MARATVADPQWMPRGPLCLRCGYALEGLGQAGTCPECGEPFFPENLVLHGVPKAHSTASRRALWALLLVVLIAHVNTWLMQPRYMCVAVSLSIVAGFIALIATSTRERSGTERFVLSAGGICRAPAKGGREGDADSLFIPWKRGDAVIVKRIGPAWKQIRIGTVSGGVFRNPVFEAGFRCSDQEAAQVRRTIEELMAWSGPGSPPATGPRDSMEPPRT